MKKHNQNGFTIVEMIIGLVIIGAVSFGGYAVWHNQHNKNSSTSSSSSSPASTQKYFTIKEWGVRAPYSGSLNLEYLIGTDSLGVTNASFSSNELDASDAICKSSGDRGGVINRYLSTDHFIFGELGEDSGKTAAQYAATLPVSDYGRAGNYYFFYVHPQAACSASQSSEDIQTQTDDAVKALTPKLQAIPQ